MRGVSTVFCLALILLACLVLGIALAVVAAVRPEAAYTLTIIGGAFFVVLAVLALPHLSKAMSR